MSGKFPDFVYDIQKRIKGQRVLDIGCLATNKKHILKKHKEYRKFAKEIIGVDYNKQILRIVEKQGEKNIYYLDITDNEGVNQFISQFGTFDHIIATDVIEHIGNLTLCLDNIYRLLNSDGNLYLTTPNALCPKYIYFATQNNGKTKVNPDHICWFDVQTLTSLLQRSKLKIKKIQYQKTPDKEAKSLGIKYEAWMGKRIYVIATK